MIRRTAIFLLVFAALPASAHAARTYRVALSGKVTAAVTKSQAIPAPDGCTGTVLDTRRLTASFRVAAVRSMARPADRKFGWLHFKARIASPRYTYRLDTSGGWSLLPGEDTAGLPPSTCAFTHEHRKLGCNWLRGSTSRRGMWFTLVPVDGRYNVVLGVVRTTLLNCQRHENLDLMHAGPPRTKLRESAVKRLRPGRRVGASGTAISPYDYDSDNPRGYERHRGQERFKYRVTVTRVR